VQISLADGRSVACLHIVGTLRRKGTEKAPDKLELWADAESGVAMRLIASWDEPAGTLGHQRIEIEFVDTPALADDWFLATGHSSPGRRVLRFDSTE
jgi:hypothetical protein